MYEGNVSLCTEPNRVSGECGGGLGIQLKSPRSRSGQKMPHSSNAERNAAGGSRFRVGCTKPPPSLTQQPPSNPPPTAHHPPVPPVLVVDSSFLLDPLLSSPLPKPRPPPPRYDAYHPFRRPSRQARRSFLEDRQGQRRVLQHGRLQRSERPPQVRRERQPSQHQDSPG